MSQQSRDDRNGSSAQSNRDLQDDLVQKFAKEMADENWDELTSPRGEPKEYLDPHPIENEIREILINDFNPVFGPGNDAPRDEYDSYIPDVICILSEGAGPEEIQAHLESLEFSGKGLEAIPNTVVSLTNLPYSQGEYKNAHGVIEMNEKIAEYNWQVAPAIETVSDGNGGYLIASGQHRIAKIVASMIPTKVENEEELVGSRNTKEKSFSVAFLTSSRCKRGQEGTEPPRVYSEKTDNPVRASPHPLQRLSAPP